MSNNKKQITSINERVFSCRQDKKLSQQRFADALGVSRGYIGDIERGRSEPSFNFLTLITSKIGISIDWLLSGDGEMYRQEQNQEPILKSAHSTGRESDDISALTDRIFKVRKNKGLNQKDFSQSTGVSRSTLSEIENGKTRPSSDIVVGIVQSFEDINPDWLLTGKGEMYRKEENKVTDLKAGYSTGIVTPSAILNRMCLVLNVQADAQLSQALGEPSEKLKQWREQGQVPYEYCEQFADVQKISLKWLITGFGDINSADTIDRRMYMINQLMEALPDQQQQEILAAIKEKERINALERQIAALTSK